MKTVTASVFVLSVPTWNFVSYESAVFQLTVAHLVHYYSELQRIIPP
jgi:hypothetical protein